MMLDARDWAESQIYPELSAQLKTRALTLAVNEPRKFFSIRYGLDTLNVLFIILMVFVRGKNVKLHPGEQVMLRIKQTQHVATERFKAQSLATRKCRFPEENPGTD